LYGIYIFDSYNNRVFGNIVSENRYGIRAKDSKNNHFFRNVVTNNKNGMLICCGAENNVIFLNIFINNSIANAEDESNNQWDNGSIGNYWDDYLEKHPDAIQTNGIWNEPYNLTGTYFWDNKDRYPIVSPMDI
jgi:parallel beta-helix repeat protein